MDTPVAPTSGIKNNKGKFAVLLLYVLFVLISPLQFFTPAVQNRLVDFTHSIVTPEADAFFKNYIGLLRDGDAEGAYSLVSEDAPDDLSLSEMQKFAPYFASSTDQIEIVGGGRNTRITDQGSTTTYNVIYEVKTTDTESPYQIVEIVAQDSGSGLEVLGIHASGFKESVKERFRFNFASQGVYLILALLIPLFIVYTAYRYITKAKNPRWVLFLVILFATLYFYANSGSGGGVTVGFSGFMSLAGPWGPWVFYTPLPLGAIYYYFVRKRHEVA